MEEWYSHSTKIHKIAELGDFSQQLQNTEPRLQIYVNKNLSENTPKFNKRHQDYHCSMISRLMLFSANDFMIKFFPRDGNVTVSHIHKRRWFLLLRHSTTPFPHHAQCQTLHTLTSTLSTSFRHLLDVSYFAPSWAVLPMIDRFISFINI
jgi:hypothetical protein